MIDYPPEIQNENQKAWYLRHFMGYSYREIGEALAKDVIADEAGQMETAAGE